MDSLRLSLAQNNSGTPQENLLNDQNKSALYKGVSVTQKNTQCQLTGEHSEQSHDSTVNTRSEDKTPDNSSLSISKENNDSERKVTIQNPGIKDSTKSVCYCHENCARSGCKLPDVFIPQRSDGIVQHIADERLLPDDLQRIGIEMETDALEFINTTAWFKGQIQALPTITRQYL